jgi:hypothetical protein
MDSAVAASAAPVCRLPSGRKMTVFQTAIFVNFKEKKTTSSFYQKSTIISAFYKNREFTDK